MGIYLPNIKMPKDCMECALETDYRTCGYYSLYVEAGHETPYNGRLKECPLVEVPPHGDLIDRDKLREKEFIHDGDAYAVVMSRDIRNAPIIIPAEEGES